jgi:hypothetical protein
VVILLDTLVSLGTPQANTWMWRYALRHHWQRTICITRTASG